MSERVEFPPRIFVPEDRYGADLSLAAAVPQAGSDNTEYVLQSLYDQLLLKASKLVETLAEVYGVAGPLATCDLGTCPICAPKRELDARVQSLLREAGKL